MELQNHSKLKVEFLAASPDLRPDIVVVQIVGKVLGSWTTQGQWQLDWDAQPQILKERVSTPWGDLCPDFHHLKAGCDLSVVGRIYSPSPRGCKRMQVQLRVGQEHRKLTVFGSRRWKKAKGGDLVAGEAETFGMLDMTWSHSFGGRCINQAGDAQNHGFNPGGIGFQCCPVQALDAQLPRIEDPDHLITRIEDQPMPINLAAIPADVPLNLYPDPTPLGRALISDARVDLDPSFHNNSHPSFRFSSISPGSSFVLQGMDTLGGLAGSLPDCRYLAKIRLGDRRHQCFLEPSSIVFFPETRQVSIAYSAHFAFRWVAEQQREIEVQGLSCTKGQV